MAQKIVTVNFTSGNTLLAGLSPLVRIYELNPTAPASNPVVVDWVAMTEIGGGWYRYTFATYNPIQNYVYTVDGGVALDLSLRYQHGANENFADDVSASVWDEVVINHTGTGTTGLTLAQIKADTATIAINQTTMSALLTLLLKYEKNRTKIDLPNNQLVVYDDDGVTPIQRFNLRDFNGMPSVETVCERIPTL